MAAAAEVTDMCNCNKATLYARNTTAQLLAVGDVINPGYAIRKTGNAIHVCNDAVIVNGEGAYRFIGAFIAAPTAAGTITVTAYDNGIAIPGATASATAGAGELATLPLVFTIPKVCPKASRSAITFIVSGAAGTVSNVALDVEKI